MTTAQEQRQGCRRVLPRHAWHSSKRTSGANVNVRAQPKLKQWACERAVLRRLSRAGQRTKGARISILRNCETTSALIRSLLLRYYDPAAAASRQLRLDLRPLMRMFAQGYS